MQESLQSTCCHMYRRRTLGLTYCISIIDGHVMPCTDTLIHQKRACNVLHRHRGTCVDSLGTGSQGATICCDHADTSGQLVSDKLV